MVCASLLPAATGILASWSGSEHTEDEEEEEDLGELVNELQGELARGKDLAEEDMREESRRCWSEEGARRLNSGSSKVCCWKSEVDD